MSELPVFLTLDDLTQSILEHQEAIKALQLAMKENEEIRWHATMFLYHNHVNDEDNKNISNTCFQMQQEYKLLSEKIMVKKNVLKDLKAMYRKQCKQQVVLDEQLALF